MHPCDIAFKRVDLPIVCNIAIGMRQLPAGKSVRRESLVHQAKRALRIGIRKISVEVGDLGRKQKAFVNDGATRQRRNVKKIFVFDVRFGDFQLRSFPDDVELPLESVFIHFRRTRDKDLLNIWLRCSRDPADGVTIHRRIAPAQNTESLFANNALEHSFTVQTRMLLDREKSYSDGVFSWRRQSKSKALAFARKELVRNLDEHSGAIASLGIAAACATVREIDQDLNSLLNDLMALFAANAGDKAHAAGIMLVRGMIKTLRRRQTVICLPAFQKSLREKSRWSFLGR